MTTTFMYTSKTMRPFITFYLMAPKILKQKEAMFLLLLFPNWFFELMKCFNMSQYQERTTADTYPRHACLTGGTRAPPTRSWPSAGAAAAGATDTRAQDAAARPRTAAVRGSGLRATAARTSNGSRFQAGDLAQIAEISSELNPGNEKSFLLLLRGWVGTGKRRRQKTGTGRRQTAKRWLPTALHGNAKADGQPGPQHTGSEGAGMCSGVSEASHRNSLASGRLVPRMQNASQGEEAQRQEVPCQCLSPRLRTSKQESTVTSPVPSSDLEGIKGE